MSSLLPSYEIVPIELINSGQSAEIVDISGSPETVCRLNEIGLSAGVRVHIVRSGMPCILSLGGRRISFRGENSAAILVRAT